MPESILETEPQSSGLPVYQSQLGAQDSGIDGGKATLREPLLIEPLRYETGRAALTSGGSEIVSRVLTIVLSIVTARVLEPVEVGLLGLAVIVIGLVSMLAFYPETSAVAARGKANDHQYALACVEVRAAVAAFSLIGLWIAFPLITHYLTGKEGSSEPLHELLRVLTWVPVLEVVSGYPQVLMQRRLQLNTLARIQLSQPIVFVALAVVLLLTGYGYIGVAWASVVSVFVTTLLLWSRIVLAKELKWEGWPSTAIRRQTWQGTGKVLLGGFGGYLGGRIDNLLVSGSIGPAAMSFYSMAWNASRTPANVFARAITFVLVPAVARIQDDPARVQRALRECLRNSYLVLTPGCAVLFVSAPLLVTYVIGPKWLPMVPALRVMCFTVLCGPMLFALGAFLTGVGKAHLVGIANVIQIGLLLAGIPFFASRWGVPGAAFGDLLAVFVLTLALFVTARIATKLPDGKLAATVLLPVAAAIAASSLAWGVGAYIADGVMRLLSEVALLVVGYLLGIIVLGGRARLFDLSALLRDIVRPQALVNPQ